MLLALIEIDCAGPDNAWNEVTVDISTRPTDTPCFVHRGSCCCFLGAVLDIIRYAEVRTQIYFWSSLLLSTVVVAPLSRWKAVYRLRFGTNGPLVNSSRVRMAQRPR